LPFADLVRLRRDEGEVFQVYRDAVARVLREVTPKDGRRVRQAFEDTVLPELNKIDAVVRNAQRKLRRSLTIDLLSGVGAVTIGLFSGILTPAAGALLAGLGGTGFVGKALRDLEALRSEPKESVRDNPYYFLWKARDHARRRAS
jgi:hypothetical protein